MKDICIDLAAECQALDDVVADIDDAAWAAVTPFDGWTVKDEISHLAYFDMLARLSASDKDGFNKEMATLIEKFETLFEYTLEPGRARTNKDLLEWWRAERKGMVAAYEVLDPKARLPWHLPMSARSSATARLMEAWAHGQDIVDALGASRPATDRLRHIAHLGVATMGWSFKCRDQEPPQTPVRVELLSPSGALWTWGPEDAGDAVTGSAEDFCLVVSQRRHYLDTSLNVKGKAAADWMACAQVFAGPPAVGPKPGAFKK